MIKLIAEILLGAVMLFLGLYSFLMIYVLLRFGQSKILGLVLSAFYLIIMISLAAAAAANFNSIPFLQLL